MTKRTGKFIRGRTLFSVAVIPLLACILQWRLWEHVLQSPWFFFWPAMFLSTWIGNRREGIAATLISAALAWWFFIPPPHALLKHEPIYYFSALLFIGIGLLTSLLQQRLRSSQRRIARLLSHSEESRQLLLESLADGVFVAQDYRFRFSNHALPAMLGYAGSEFVDMPFERVVAPNFLEVWTTRFEQRIGSGDEPQKYYEVQFLRKDGSPLWVELRASRARYRNRPAVLGIIRDISERKLHDEKLRLAEAVVHNTQEAVVVTDLDCRILAVNPAFSIVTEYAEEELIGQHIRIVKSGKHDSAFYQEMWHSITHYGNWQGAIWNRRKSGDIYQEWLTINTVHDEAGHPIQYIGISLDISRSAHVETHMEYMAHHDALTGLPNRLLLHSRLEHTLERAKRDARLCAVLFLDLDRFKVVNDTLGHAAGDELLKLAAARMKERLRDIDTLARFGGDEFVMVLDGIDTPAEAGAVAQALIERLRAPFELRPGVSVHIGTSVGIALFPEHGHEAHALIHLADTALYAAKQAGKGRWMVYVPAKQ